MSSDCRYGFLVPTRGPLAAPDTLAALVRKGEELGFSIMAVSDHVVKPKSVTSRYPYSETGKYVSDASGECLEQLALVSFLAGQTTTARLLTSVMVLPHRSPVLAAKMLASIDVFSKGRLDVGCGAGWMREEFEAIGAPPYDDRGAVSDEYIRAIKELWTSESPHFEGRYCRFSSIMFMPKPVQKPHPPIWIGGESPAALRRVVRHGNVWYPRSSPKYPVDTVEQFSESVTRLRRFAKEAGRNPSDIEIAYTTEAYNEHTAQPLPSGSRCAFTGTPSQIADDIRGFKELGMRHLVIDFQADTFDKTIGRLEHFATNILPRAGR